MSLGVFSFPQVLFERVFYNNSYPSLIFIDWPVKFVLSVDGIRRV